MNHVDQAQLSPVRTRPEPVPLPYGLTADDLLPLFGSGTVLGRLTCHGSHRKQGLHGGANSCIVTLVLVTPFGRRLRQTVFIKATADSAEREADATACPLTHLRVRSRVQSAPEDALLECRCGCIRSRYVVVGQELE